MNDLKYGFIFLDQIFSVNFNLLGFSVSFKNIFVFIFLVCIFIGFLNFFFGGD